MAEEKSILPWDILKTDHYDDDLPSIKYTGDQCKKLSGADGSIFYLYLDKPNLDSLDQLYALNNISSIPTTDGIYNYIIYVNNEGNPSILFAKHVFPNEIASKHIYLLLFAISGGHTRDMSVLLAGELKKQREKMIINFQSGTFTLNFKRKWQSTYPKEESSSIERKWFESLTPLFSSKLNTSPENINYVSPSFFDDETIPFDKDSYVKLASFGINIRFFKDENMCKAFKVLNIINISGPISTLTFVRNRDIFYKNPETDKIEVKPEYKNLNINEVSISLDEMIKMQEEIERKMSGGRRIRKKNKKHNYTKKNHNKNHNRNIKKMKPKKSYRK
jgi:hypothetical protein